MSAALHLMPGPDDEPTPPLDTAGEHPSTPAIQQPGEPPALDDVQPGEHAEPHDEEELEDEEPAPGRTLAMPDLRPYASLEWIPAVINAGVEGARRRREHAPERKAARKARKAERHAADEPAARPRPWLMAVDYLTGTRILLGHLIAWLGGEHGPKGMTVPARLGATGLSLYFAYRTATTWPVWGPVGLTAAYCCATLGVLHKQRAAQAKKKPSPKAAKTVTKTPEPPPADTLVEDAGEADEHAPGEAAEEVPEQSSVEAAVEPPAPPSREVIAGALYGLYRGGSGVLLTALRQHLSLPHTRAVREVLGEAGIRVREGVRTPAGNGPGIHTDDFPPQPPSPDLYQGEAVVAGQSANNNNANAESGGEKGFGVDGTYWPVGRLYHFAPHPTNPHGTVIVHHEEGGNGG
jgi:hypothetical protein